MRDQEFNYTPQGEFNTPSQEEFHPSKDEFYLSRVDEVTVGGLTPKKHGRDRLRRTALIQAAAVIVVAAVAVDSFGAGLIGGPGLPPATVESMSPNGSKSPVETERGETASPSRDALLPLTAEQKAYLDALYAACLDEDDTQVRQLTQQPVEIGIETCFYDGTQAFRFCENRKALMLYRYMSLEYDQEGTVVQIQIDRETEAGLFSVLINRSEMGENTSAYFKTVDEADAEGTTLRCHGYYKHIQRYDGYSFESEMRGEFVRAPRDSEYPEESALFLENGTLLTNSWTALADGGSSPPIQFEVRNGYLLADGILTVETDPYGTVWLTYDPAGVTTGASWPDDPFYHTHSQETYLR